MYAITGITGKVGGAAARALLAAHQGVRAIVRDPSKGKPWADRGSGARKGTITLDQAITALVREAQ